MAAVTPVVLTPHTTVDRPLSAYEYFHASVGTSPHTLDGAREILCIVEGVGHLPHARWRDALAQVVAKNPGCRLRVVGTRQRARFVSDGVPMALRVVAEAGWDGVSHVGSEALYRTPFKLDTGPLNELLLIESEHDGVPLTRVIVRTHHAAMDGLGMAHTLQELFRALRGEPLLGSNAPFSDADLMRHLGVTHSTSKPIRAAMLTGAAVGEDPARWWRRIAVPGGRSNSMQRLIAALIECAREHSPDEACLFSIPINLRRHLAGLHTVQNFGSMLFVPVQPGESARDFKQHFNRMLNANMDAALVRGYDAIRRLPMPWVDWLTQRRPANFTRRRPLETCMVSHLGYLKKASLSCPGFASQTVWAVSGASTAFCTVFGTESQLEVVFGLPAVYGSDGRFDAVVAALERHLEIER